MQLLYVRNAFQQHSHTDARKSQPVTQNQWVYIPASVRAFFSLLCVYPHPHACVLEMTSVSEAFK